MLIWSTNLHFDRFDVWKGTKSKYICLVDKQETTLGPKLGISIKAFV